MYYIYILQKKIICKTTNKNHPKVSMAQLCHLEIGIDATDQLLIQFKLENVLNIVSWNIYE